MDVFECRMEGVFHTVFYLRLFYCNFISLKNENRKESKPLLRVAFSDFAESIAEKNVDKI